MMWQQKHKLEKKEGSKGLVAVGIDNDRSSQNALRWATDHLVGKGQTLILIHVRLHSFLTSSPSMSSQRQNLLAGANNSDVDQHMRELFLPFRCFCTRREIEVKDVVLDDADVGKALVEYATQAAVENLVLGSCTKGNFLRRFKATDIAATVAKSAPDFCNVILVSKTGKVNVVHSASRSAPAVSPLLCKSHNQPEACLTNSMNSRGSQRSGEVDSIKSPFLRRKAANGRSYGELSLPENDISFVCSARPSTERMHPPYYDTIDMGRTPPRVSSCSDTTDRSSFDSSQFGRMSYEFNSQEFFPASHESNNHSWSSQPFDDVEAEMRRLKLELKQTMDMYSTACKEALSAKQMAKELQRWKIEEEQRLEEARMAEEAALAVAEKEKAKSRAAWEHAEAAKRIAELESQKRANAEMKALREAEEKKAALNALSYNDVRYRKYSIDEIETATESFAAGHKIGEGGYGPVFKSYLDHTEVAIKVLRPDAAQGRSQFQREVEVLSCIRHPNMVLLLGACPEYGCLVYEYMANGSLEDRLFCRGNTPPLPWQLRFRIAAEIGTGLLFLHQSKPEPIVHRDLKPGNILLDRNFVSKISDVGLARLVPPSVADNVTQYRVTSTAGTFCYIDPEYQQTGMLGIKSDIYSFGILLLQIITAKPPMGLTHHVEQAIEKGSFADMLDPSVPDWPVDEALNFANVALKCAELRRKDRPDLGKLVLPELNRLRAVAEENAHPLMLGSEGGPFSRVSCSSQDTLSDIVSLSDCGSSKSRSAQSMAEILTK